MTKKLIDLKGNFKYRIVSKFLTVLYLILVPTAYSYDELNQPEDKNNIEDIKKEKNLSSQYLLGYGDSLKIDFYGLEIFSGIYPLTSEGYLIMPEIGKIYAKDLSLSEITSLLNEQYKEYIINTNITVNLVSFKPITVLIAGEVKSPGIYTFQGTKTQGTKTTAPLINKTGSFTLEVINVKIYDAIKQAKGLNNFADISNIEIVRKNPSSQGGGKIKAKINLLSAVTNGDLSQNIRIHDGDFIRVPKSNKIIKEQVLAINNMSINPDEITVYVTGNVEKPGPFLLKKGSTLLQAISSTGGKKLMTGNIEFLRFKDDGTTNNYKFKYDQNALSNTKKNPILMDGDVINVRKTLLGKTTEVLSEISNPVLSGYGLYRIFN